MMNYEDFIASKKVAFVDSGFEVSEYELNPALFDFQKYIVKKALSKGRFAIWADCGLGKTLMQLEWANRVSTHTKKPVLVLAPLAVSAQTIKEGEKFNIGIKKYDGSDFPIQITNYEQIENIDCSLFSGVVLDESSILKNYSGATKTKIIESFNTTPFKLACTATPSPNDELEIGNHSEFLNVMESSDMRALFFTTDKEIIKGNKYRLKKHAEKDFYKWISSWAIMISKPEDIGFKADGYHLPPLNYIERQIETEKKNNGLLFNDVAVSATSFNQELKLTKVDRMDQVAEIVNASDEPFIIWIKHNEEGEYLLSLIPDAVEVKGSDKPEQKEKNLLAFADGKFRVLITKAKIAQFGMNFQNCNNQVFASLDFSFESLYQSIRRSFRFGQKKIVNIYLITTDTMQNVIKSIEEKQEKFIRMQDEMREAIMLDLKLPESKKKKDARIENGLDWKLILGDSCKELKSIQDNSVHYSFSSPPFGALYVFSNDPRDLSNVKDNDEFMKHYRFIVQELFRVIKLGRLCSIHMMQSTTLLGRDGFYSIVDFRGDLIRLFQDCGFHFHAENMIRKDPKTAAIRTKNRQLMWGTTKKDSSIVRPGLADYILTFKKPGENEEPIINDIPFDLWCKIAEPVWIDINEGDTIEHRSARENDDERHITATQLQPIEWCYLMWTNKGDTVISPFNGVGSEGVKAIEMDRKYIGIELKESYFETSVRNLKIAEQLKGQKELFNA